MGSRDPGSGLEPNMQPRLDEFLLARIAEEKRDPPAVLLVRPYAEHSDYRPEWRP